MATLNNPHGHKATEHNFNKEHLDPSDPNHAFAIKLHETSMDSHSPDEKASHKASAHLLSTVSKYAGQSHRDLVKNGGSFKSHLAPALEEHANKLGTPTEGMTTRGVLHATVLGLTGSSKQADAIANHHQKLIEEGQAAKNAKANNQPAAKPAKEEPTTKTTAAPRKRGESVKKSSCGLDELESFEEVFRKSFDHVFDYEFPVGGLDGDW